MPERLRKGGGELGCEDGQGRRLTFPVGWDYAWLAMDGAGQVAVFTNAGQGPVPLAVIADRPAADEAEDLVSQLPVRGEAVLLVDVPRPDSFVNFATRGWFVYDWADVHRTNGFRNQYELQARPLTPILADALPEELARLAGYVRFGKMSFTDTPAISITEYVACGQPPSE